MSIFSVFTLLGGLAFFIYGMNQISHSLEVIAGDKMEAVINKLTSSRLLGLLLGCVITIALQSSSAVTVMLVGLVNATGSAKSVSLTYRNAEIGMRVMSFVKAQQLDSGWQIEWKKSN